MEWGDWSYYALLVLGSNALITNRSPTTLPSACVLLPHIDHAEYFRHKERGASTRRSRGASVRRGSSARPPPLGVIPVEAGNRPTLLSTSFGALPPLFP